MADDAEKLISLSLCKLNKTIRRTCLHKNLLINTVLIKARSAFFEAWYMGDGGEVTQTRNNNGHSVDLNSSYQEVEFPTDEDDEDDADDNDDDICDDFDFTTTTTSTDQKEVSVSMTNPPEEEEILSSSSSMTQQQFNDEKYIDPRFFVEIEQTDNESEIELPSDILNCVEKMGEFSDFDQVNESASSSNVLQVHDSDQFSSTPPPSPQQLIYLDLDSKEPSEFNHHGGVDEQSQSSTTPTPVKRRRNWSLEKEDEEEENEKNPNSTVQLRISKRLKFSPIDEDIKDNGSTILLSPSIISSRNEFRTKKSHFDEEDGGQEEESDDDSFLGDNNDSSNNSDQQRRKNDQRVPSGGGSSGSSSDEDQDDQMDIGVDQITDLVQYISFNKQQQQQNQIPDVVPPSSSSKLVGRSMSSPDLCGLASTSNNNSSTNSNNNNNNAKDIFNYKISHRVLTMKV